MKLERKLNIIPVQGGEPLAVIPLTAPIFNFEWSPDSKAITFPMVKDGLEQIISHPLVVGPPKVLFEASPDDLGPFAWSPDGRRLYYTSGPVSSNVVMFNLER